MPRLKNTQTMPLNIWWSYATEHIWRGYSTEHMAGLCYYDGEKNMLNKKYWNNTEGHSFKTLRFFQVIRLCSHRLTFMLMTWKMSSIFSTVIACTITMKLPPSPRIIWSSFLISYSSIKSSAYFLLKHICWSRYLGSSPHHKLHSSGYNCCWGPIGMHHCTAWPTTPLHSTSNNLYNVHCT